MKNYGYPEDVVSFYLYRMVRVTNSCISYIVQSGSRIYWRFHIKSDKICSMGLELRCIIEWIHIHEKQTISKGQMFGRFLKKMSRNI